MSAQENYADGDDQWIRQAQAASERPLPTVPEGAARMHALVSLQLSADDGAAEYEYGFATLDIAPEFPELPTYHANAQVDFVAAPVWLEPPGIILVGVVTIIGVNCRHHLIEGAEVLVSALRAELQRTAAGPLADFPAFASAPLPTAEDLVEMAGG